MIKKAWKKNIAILLVIAMMLTIMPMTVFAEGEDGGTETDVTVATLYDNNGEELEQLSPAESAQAVIAKWTTAEKATTVYVTWNVGDTARQEVAYDEEDGAYISQQDIIVTEDMDIIEATFSTEDETEAVAKLCCCSRGRN